MPNTETKKTTNPKTEDPLSTTIRRDLQGRRIDLTALNENDRIELDTLSLIGDGLTHLKGTIIVRGKVTISDCPNLVSIQNIQSTSSIRIERCPKLEDISVLECAKSACVCETAIHKVTDKWYVGDNLIAENNSDLELVEAPFVGGVASFNNSQNLKRVSGNFDDILFLEGCSLESLKVNALRIVGIDEDEIAALQAVSQFLPKQTRRIVTDKFDDVACLKEFAEKNSYSQKDAVVVSPKKSTKPSKTVRILSVLGQLFGLTQKKACHHKGYANRHPLNDRQKV